MCSLIIVFVLAQVSPTDLDKAVNSYIDAAILHKEEAIQYFEIQLTRMKEELSEKSLQSDRDIMGVSIQATEEIIQKAKDGIGCPPWLIKGDVHLKVGDAVWCDSRVVVKDVFDSLSFKTTLSEHPESTGPMYLLHHNSPGRLAYFGARSSTYLGCVLYAKNERIEGGRKEIDVIVIGWSPFWTKVDEVWKKRFPDKASSP